MTDLHALYGTDQPVDPGRKFSVGAVAFRFCNGVVSHLTVDGHELIRQIAFLVRDGDWGTVAPRLSEPAITSQPTGLALDFSMTYASKGAGLSVALRLEATETGLEFQALGRSEGAFETNRAGFTVLHPITGQAGAPVEIVHADGSRDDATFPDRIAPWQPFKDIAELTHFVGPLTCRTAFTGDVFEMEDQRQWGDASFKTYNRPLALPWPYEISNGARIEQAVRVDWGRQAAVPVNPSKGAPARKARFPDTALLLTPDQARRATQTPAELATIGVQRVLCHVDATLGSVGAQFDAFAGLQAALPKLAYDLELIGAFAGGAAVAPEPELSGHAGAMRRAGFAPDSVMVCPSVDRQSTPPGSDWPDCPPLEAVHAAARRAFAVPAMGGGMASLFTELNRKRPPVERLDFVTHALCPIVHDASDDAVMATLETIPHITRSARAILGDTEYRIGPCTLAMRQNPYGSRTFPNPDGARICMTHDDPRHRAAFGAAYALGLATALAPADIAVWTPAELYGPRGLWQSDGQLVPLAHVVRQLARCAGRAVLRADTGGQVARLDLQGATFRVNLTPETAEGLAAFGYEVQSDGEPGDP